MIELLQALLTPLVAVITTYIAYQQYRMQSNERALALYDRRLAVFRAAISIVDRVRAGEHMTCSQALEWLSSVAEAQFLLGDEVQAVIDPLFGAVYDYAATVEPVATGKPYDTACAESALRVEDYREPLMEAFRFYLQPSGSPAPRKRRIGVKEVERMLPTHIEQHSDEDIPL